MELAIAWHPGTLALDARTQAFPVLTEAQINRIRPGGKLREVKKDDILFEPGDISVPFFVLLAGAMQIVQPDLVGERLITTHGPGQFTGEMTMISGQRCLVRVRMTEAGKLLELSGDGLRSWWQRMRSSARFSCERLSCADWHSSVSGTATLSCWVHATRRTRCACASFLPAMDILTRMSISIWIRVLRNFWTVFR